MTEAVNELKQIKGILGKMLSRIEGAEVDGCTSTTEPRYHRETATAKNVTRAVDGALRHIDKGNIGLAKQMLIHLKWIEGN